MTKAEQDASRTHAIALAQHIGQRPAAREIAISENTMRSWCMRFRRKHPEVHFSPVPIGKRIPQPNATAVHEAYGAAIENHSNRSRLALAQAGTNASEHFATLKGGEFAVKDTAIALEATTRAIDRTHGWSIAAQQAPAVNVAVAVTLPTPEERSERNEIHRKLNAISDAIKAKERQQSGNDHVAT